MTRRGLAAARFAMMLHVMMLPSAWVSEAFAGISVVLKDQTSEESVYHSYFGTCGPSKVFLHGVPSRGLGVGCNTSLALNPGYGSATDFTYALSDFNKIVCVESAGKSLLVVWSDCSGTACGRGGSYFVIDPTDPPKLVSPHKPGEVWCDRECASKFVGEELLPVPE